MEVCLRFKSCTEEDVIKSTGSGYIWEDLTEETQFGEEGEGTARGFLFRDLQPYVQAEMLGRKW